jgi:hypothetical protein
VLGEEQTRQALRLSIETSLCATGIAIVLGVPLAFVQARVPYPGRRVVRALVLLPLVLPPVVGGIALLEALGRRGLVGQYLDKVGVNLPFHVGGAVLAETFVAMPFLVLTLEGAFRSSDRGRSWSVADTPIHAGNSAAGIFSVAFRDAQHGIAVGGEYSKPRQAFDNVAVTSDGGRTWRLARGPLPPGYMSAVAYVPDTGGRSLVAVGLAGTATSNDGGESWSMVDTVAYNSVTFASRNDGWAAGPKGRIAKWAPTPGSGKP